MGVLRSTGVYIVYSRLILRPFIGDPFLFVFLALLIITNGAVFSVIQEFPSAVYLLDSPPFVVSCSAVFVWRKEFIKGGLRIFNADLSAVR